MSYSGSETTSKSGMSSTSAKNSGPGLGKKATVSGDPVDMGLNARERIAGGTRGKIRSETGEATQRPKATDKPISSDRGNFPSRC